MFFPFELYTKRCSFWRAFRIYMNYFGTERRWSARSTTAGVNDVRAYHCQGLRESQEAFENSRNSLFCRANFALSFEVLHDLNHRSIAENIAKQWKIGKGRFFNGQLEHVILSIAAFFNSKSEKAETLDLEVSHYGLSFEIKKSKIIFFAPAGLGGGFMDRLLSFFTRRRLVELSAAAKKHSRPIDWSVQCKADRTQSDWSLPLRIK